MKLGLASDLHLEFEDINSEFLEWRGDVLLLAGDIGTDDHLRKHGNEFFDKVSEMAPVVLIIGGNHEYYHSEIDTADDHLDEFLEQWKNIIPLRNRSIRVGKLDVFGGTMWTDFHGSPIAEMIAQSQMNDYNHIRVKSRGYTKIRPSDVVHEYQKCYNALLDWIATPSDGARLVMTHHAPSVLSVPRNFQYDFELNKAYCNHFETFIENTPEIKAWVHGHTHDFFDYEIGSTRIMCNPRGYPNQRPVLLPPYQPLSFEL